MIFLKSALASALFVAALFYATPTWAESLTGP